MLSTRDKLAAGRLVVVKKCTYYRTGLNSMIPHEAPGLDTFGVTKSAIMYYDPAVVTEWSVEELAGVTAHELLHLTRRHADRIGDRNPEAWNRGADAEIYDDLIAMGFVLPDDPVTPASLGMPSGLTAEEYYRAALTQQRAAQGGSGGQGTPDPDGQPQDGTGQPGDNSDGKKGVGSGQCGGCAGNPGPHEVEIEAQVKGRSPRQMEQVRRATAEAVKKAAERGAGNVPGGLLRWADEELRPPTIPWRQKLARVVRGALAYRPGAVDLCHTRISRRQAGLGFGPGRPVLSALHAPVPAVGVLLDASGSMGTEELVDGGSEIAGILRAVGADVTFAVCDAALQGIAEVRRWQDAVRLIKGGGGTDLSPAFKALTERRQRLDVIIVITDGELWSVPPEPPCKVIWVLVGPKATPAPWGEIVRVEHD